MMWPTSIVTHLAIQVLPQKSYASIVIVVLFYWYSTVSQRKDLFFFTISIYGTDICKPTCYKIEKKHIISWFVYMDSLINHRMRCSFLFLASHKSSLTKTFYFLYDVIVNQKNSFFHSWKINWEKNQLDYTSVSESSNCLKLISTED